MILIEDGPNGQPALFDGAIRQVVALSADQVLPCLRDLDAALADGKWIAGYLSYEAGYALEPRLAALMPTDLNAPLLAFGIYDAPQDGRETLTRAGVQAQGVRVPPPVPAISRAQYDAAIAQVLAYIGAGDCYQINLTFPMTSRLDAGTPLGLFGALRQRQKVGHGSFVALDTGPILISRSPELFLRLDANGRIEARPMKGTAPRDADPVRDGALAQELRASAKGQAENLMIVDLLRNDIARISKLGSVKVPQLFGIETYATLHQMVSRVVGQLAAPATLTALMTALFPCGSITGAPKIRAMQIIRALETSPRGAYCGAIGWMAPDGAASFSVAIRTLSLCGQDITLNVGGGIVHDSTALGEWDEALWKARYMNGLMSS